MLWKPRWVVGHFLVVTLAVTFVALGFWQLGRHRDAQREEREAREALEHPTIEGVDVTALGAGDASSRPTVRASGRYDRDHEVMVRGRERDGAPGYGVLTPLVLDDGTAVLVDRGFVPAADEATLEGDAAAPVGTVEISGTARPAQSVQPGEAAEPSGTPPAVDRVVPETIAASLPYDVLPVWIVLEVQEPQPASGLPAPTGRVTADDGGFEVNHLHYAIQWFALAAIPVVGWPIVLRRKLRAH